MVPDLGTCIVHTVFRIRSVRTTCRATGAHWAVGAKTHLAGGGWRAIIQEIAIRILCAVRALRKRRGRQSDRHQRCGNERFVVYHRGFPSLSEFKLAPRCLGGLLSRRDNPALPLRSHAFFEAIDGPSSTRLELRRAWRTPVRPLPAR